ncbi:MAG: hypothetical protein ABIH23_24540 [bacterium]
MASGKKIALWGCLGCGGFILVAILLIAGGAGLFAYKMHGFGKEIQKAYRQVVENYKALDAQYPFEPPEDGILAETRLDAFLRIRSEIAMQAKGQREQLETAAKEVGRQFKDPGVMSKIRGARTVKTLVGVAVNMASEIGKEHIRLLETEDMSVKEYQWLTQTYLGTLARAEDNYAEDLARYWKQYLDAFENTREKVRDIRMDLGQNDVRGDDMNSQKLMEALQPVAYIPQNAASIGRTMDRLLPNETVGLIDFLTLHLDRIMEGMFKQTPGVEASPDRPVEESEQKSDGEKPQEESAQ